LHALYSRVGRTRMHLHLHLHLYLHCDHE